jgi:hypothetical protein
LQLQATPNGGVSWREGERRPQDYLSECTVGRVYLLAGRGEFCEVGAELGKKRLEGKQRSIQQIERERERDEETRELTAY